MVLAVGVLTTDRRVAASSMLSTPTPARDHLEARRSGNQLGVDGGGATQDHGVGIGDGGEQPARSSAQASTTRDAPAAAPGPPRHRVATNTFGISAAPAAGAAASSRPLALMAEICSPSATARVRSIIGKVRHAHVPTEDATFSHPARRR